MIYTSADGEEIVPPDGTSIILTVTVPSRVSLELSKLLLLIVLVVPETHSPVGAKLSHDLKLYNSRPTKKGCNRTKYFHSILQIQLVGVAL